MSLLLPPSQQMLLPWPLGSGSPLENGLSAVFTPDGYDAITRKVPSETVGTKDNPASFGPAKGFGSTSGIGSTDSILTGNGVNSNAFSVVVPLISNGSGGGTYGRVFQKGDGTVGYESLLMQNNGAVSLELMHNGPSGVKQDAAITIPASGTPFVFAGVTKFANGNGSGTSFMDLYVNGRRGTYVASSVSYASLVAVTSKEYRIGNRKDAIRNWDGVIGPMLMFDRELSAEEVLAISTAIIRTFQRRRRRSYFDMGAAGGGGATYNVSVTEALPLSEVQGSSLLALAANSENLVLSDLVSAIAAFISTSAESVGLSESSTASQVTVAAAVEALALLDQQDTSAGAVSASQTETVSLSDSHSALGLFLAARVEAITLSEYQNSGAGVISADLVESLPLLEAHSANKQTGATQTEALALTDTQAAASTLFAAVLEALSLTDQQLAAQQSIVLQVEQVSFTDSVTAPAIWTVSITEGMSLADLISLAFDLVSDPNFVVSLPTRVTVVGLRVEGYSVEAPRRNFTVTT